MQIGPRSFLLAAIGIAVAIGFPPLAPVLTHARFQQVSSAPFSVAGPAPSFVSPALQFLKERVFLRQFMVVDTMGFSRIDSGGRFATQNVDLSGYWLQVLRVETGAVAAQVIEVQPVRDRTNQQRVCPAMNEQMLDEHSVDDRRRLGVAGDRIHLARPYPAFAFPALVQSQAFTQPHGLKSHDTNIVRLGQFARRT